MELVSPFLCPDIATVEKDGIHFRDLCYVFKYAMKLQWYEKALTEGPWSVPVYFDPQANQFIFIVLEDGLMAVAQLYSQQQAEMSVEEMEQYHQAMNELKEAKTSRRTVKRKDAVPLELKLLNFFNDVGASNDDDEH